MTMRHTLRASYRIARDRHTLKGLVALALIGAVALLAAGYLLASKTSRNSAVAANNALILNAIQRERARNTRLSCQQSNREHLAIINFIASSVPAKRLKEPRVKAYLKLAAKSFPVVDCNALVRQRVPNRTLDG